jgi:hypothetical protein
MKDAAVLVLMRTNECTATPQTVSRVQYGEAGEHDRHPRDHVDHEVVGRRHDSEDHRRRACHRERTQQQMPGGLEDHDAQEHVPPGVEARHRGVLVDEILREHLPIALCAARDRVDEGQVREAGRRHRIEGEHDEADEAAEQASVP